MKLGLCKNLNDDCFKEVSGILDLGIDYLEINASMAVNYTLPELREYKKKAENLGLNILSSNGYFPKDIKFVGDNIDLNIIKEYAKNASEKLAELGVKKAVFGSGASRKVPEGYSRETALSQVEEALGIVNEESVKANIEIVIEPLSRSETNVINTVREAFDFCKKINLQNVHVLADLYHVGQERDLPRSLNDIVECASELKHVHISCPISRTVPTETDGFDYSLFYNALKKANYKGNISIEAWPHTREAIASCRKIFDKYTK